jgi:hypothetical protein
MGETFSEEDPMSHSDAKFEKVGRTDKPLYGPEKLLLCGFSGDAGRKFSVAQKTAGLAEVSTVWVDESRAHRRLAELMELPGGTGQGAPSSLPKAVIVGGITEAQLRALMTVAKKTGVQNVLWAVLTPISESWTLSQLLAELSAERRAMQK